METALQLKVHGMALPAYVRDLVADAIGSP